VLVALAPDRVASRFMSNSTGAESVGAVLEARIGWHARIEQLAVKLQLQLRPCVGAALCLRGQTIVWDAGLTRDDQASQLARGCARYLIREGADCDEDELTLVLQLPSAPSRGLRGLRRATPRAVGSLRLARSI
jgi:hypothetical protein